MRTRETQLGLITHETGRKQNRITQDTGNWKYMNIETMMTRRKTKNTGEAQ